MSGLFLAPDTVIPRFGAEFQIPNHKFKIDHPARLLRSTESGTWNLESDMRSSFPGTSTVHRRRGRSDGFDKDDQVGEILR